MMNVEQSVEWELAGESEVLGENLPQSTLSTSNPTWPDLGSNPGRRGGKPATNRQSYCTAFEPTNSINSCKIDQTISVQIPAFNSMKYDFLQMRLQAV
jgi:hypothetical protein